MTEDLSKLIYKNYSIGLAGAVLLILAAIINNSYIFFLRFRISYNLAFLISSYGFLILMSIGTILVAISLREITDIYFVDHITKAGKSAAFWLFFYSSGFLVDMFLVGWPLTAGFAGMAILFGRFFGFKKINNVFVKIKDVFDLKISSIFYLLFSYYVVLVSLLSGIANYSQDVVFQTFIYVFNGPIDSLLLLLLAIRFIIDITRVKKFIIKTGIKPYETKTSLFVKNRRAFVEPATTKEHIQSKTEIEKLRERSEERGEMIAKIKKRQRKKLERRRKKEEQLKIKEEEFINCPVCGHRTSKNFPLCTSCGASLKKKRRGKERKTEKLSPEDFSAKEAKKLLTPKREHVLQYITITIFLVSFITYSFVTGNSVLIVYSWIILALFGTYIIVNYIGLYFVEKGFAITTVLVDFAFMFVILPILMSIVSYFILLVFEKTVGLQESLYRTLLWVLSLGLSTVALAIFLRQKVRNSKMSFKEYIKYRFDFKERAKETREERKRILKKRSYFDKLEVVEANMARQREGKVMDYKDFDVKQRLKDLGSPLRNDEEEQ
ncbi:MAG: hypothetical protein ACTSSG_01370 [Candidatus Heimdallarchaeaceae archaeon]